MKLEKIQATILKELCKPNGRVCYRYPDEVTQDEVQIIVQGDVAYRLPTKDLHVSLKGMQTVTRIPGELDSLHGALKLKPTDEYRIGGKVQKYLVNEDGSMPIYIDTGLLANFEKPILYQSVYRPLGVVTIAEYDVVADAEKIVGLVCPFSIAE